MKFEYLDTERTTITNEELIEAIETMSTSDMYKFLTIQLYGIAEELKSKDKFSKKDAKRIANCSEMVALTAKELSINTCGNDYEQCVLAATQRLVAKTSVIPCDDEYSLNMLTAYVLIKTFTIYQALSKDFNDTISKHKKTFVEMVEETEENCASIAELCEGKETKKKMILC